MVRRSNRSARNPAKGDTTTEGIMAAKVTAPTQVAEPVRCRAREALATIKAQAEDWEHRVATQSFLYSGYWSDAR